MSKKDTQHLKEPELTHSEHAFVLENHILLYTILCTLYSIHRICEILLSTGQWKFAYFNVKYAPEWNHIATLADFQWQVVLLVALRSFMTNKTECSEVVASFQTITRYVHFLSLLYSNSALNNKFHFKLTKILNHISARI